MQMKESLRRLRRVPANVSFAYQALVTQWLHENGCFTITGVEVENDNGSKFDIEVADGSAGRYCIEVWYGRCKIQHALEDSAADLCMGEVSLGPWSNPKPLPKDLREVVLNDPFNMSSKYDIPKIYDKLAQLPNDRPGFLVVCRDDWHSPLRPEGATSFPVVPPKNIPDNKCIIVLEFNGGLAPNKHGIACIVHHPTFQHVETAKRLIRALNFSHDQSIYDKRISYAKKCKNSTP